LAAVKPKGTCLESGFSAMWLKCRRH
jgi:hypothetical protein